MATSFARALSPAVNALIGSVTDSATLSDPAELDSSAMRARHTALQAASSLDELIAMVPADYRDVLRPHLLECASLSTKRLQASDTWQRWNVHWNNGDPKTFPSHIVMKSPSVQLSKEYAQTEEGRSHTSGLEKAHLAFCKGLLKDSMTAKESEIRHIDGLLSPQSLWARISPKLNECIRVLKASRKEPVFSAVLGDGAEEGEVEISGWKVSSVTTRLALEIKQDSIAFCFRATAIVNGRHAAQHSKTERKKEIAASADVEMADATKPGPSIQSMIDRAVSARLNKALPKRSNTRSEPAKGMVSNYAQLNARFRALERPRPVLPQLTSFQKKQSARASAWSRKAAERSEGSREKRRRAVIEANKARFPKIKPARKGRDQHRGAKP